MIRQFLRVKQIADQTFMRTEKTETLSEDLIHAEKRVDLIKQSCLNTGKKITACLQGVGSEASASEKKSKKLPAALLAQCMQEYSNSLGELSILGASLAKCAAIEDDLAKELFVYESSVEKNVLSAIVSLLAVDFPNIARLRKQLTKLTQEMDVAKSKHQMALKQQGSNNIASTQSKAEALQDEVEDISMRVEQCRDSLSAELFNLIARESELSSLFVQWYQLQADYHRRELLILETALPALEEQIDRYPFKPVFGQSLEEHLRMTNRQIALVIKDCVCWLLEIGMDEEGLFRIVGSASKIKKVKSAFDAGFVYGLEEVRDPHTIAGVLKSYLRELPEPLLTFHLYNDWLAAAEISDNDTRLQTLWRVLNSLPDANFNNLRYLVKFLAKLASNSEANKMSSHNLAIVITPNLIWPPFVEEPIELGYSMTMTNMLSSVLDSLITYSDWFFPGDLEFFVNTPTTPISPNGPLAFSNVESNSQFFTNVTNGELGSTTSSSNSSNTSSSPRSPSSRNRPSKKPAPPIPGKSKPSEGKHSSYVPVERSLSLADMNAQKIGNGLRQKGKSCNDLLSIEQDNTESINSINKSAIYENGGIHRGAHTINTEEPNIHKDMEYSVPLRKPPIAPRTSIQKPSVPPPSKPTKPPTQPKKILQDNSVQSASNAVELSDISCSFQDDVFTEKTQARKDDGSLFYQGNANESLNKLKELLSYSFETVKTSDSNRNVRSCGDENSNTECEEQTKLATVQAENEILYTQVESSISLHKEKCENKKDHAISGRNNNSISLTNDGNIHSANGGILDTQAVSIPDKQYCTVIHVPGAGSKPKVPSPVAKERRFVSLRPAKAIPVLSPQVPDKSRLNSLSQNTRL